jgi:CO/xanthine dehydrogenase FAD-binding subunit
MRPFKYLRPLTLKEACDSLSDWSGDAQVLAGGTDLVLALKEGKKRPACVIDVKALPELQSPVQMLDHTITFGAGASMHALVTQLPASCAALAEAAAVVGSRQIRNRATVGGNLMQASPAAETVPPLVVLGASAELCSTHGRRIVPLEEFFSGPNTTNRRPDEMLVSIGVPAPGPSLSAAYFRFTPRRAMDIAVVNVAVSLTMNSAGECRDCRIALGSVGPTVLRSRRAEETLWGNTLTPELIDEAAVVASSEAQPIDDVRASAGFRRELIVALVRRAATAAVSRQTPEAHA